MDQTILALLGVIITLMLYLDRGRRADLAQLRNEVHLGESKLRQEMQAGFAQLTEMIMDLVARVGRLEGRTEMIMELVNRGGRLEGRAEAVATPTEPSQ